VQSSHLECDQLAPPGDAMRAKIRGELESIVPLDVLERQHQSEAIAWVDSGAPLFRTRKPATPPRHLVSYFAVVDGESILLVDHKNARLWLPPGGHVEDGEHPRETVARELREELGFSPTHAIAAPLMVTCTTTVGLTAGHTDVSLWYVVNATRGQALAYDAQEFDGLRWFDYSEAPLDRSDPHLERFLRKLRQRNR
jgi:ADP-ribose pyrophosphatase YjhB (NUDIX family)